MDSVVGSLALSYYYTQQSGILHVPVINCNRDEFFCKLEIVTHLRNCNIPQDDLFFWDEFKAKYKTKQIDEVILVDHNTLDVT